MPKKVTKLTPARRMALTCLLRIFKKDSFASDVISSYIDTSDLSAKDKAFATKLILGVVSYDLALDRLIDSSLRSPKDIKSNVRCALKISTYEMLVLRKEPRIVVSQGVELVASIAPKARGLANSVLRKISLSINSMTDSCETLLFLDKARLLGYSDWMSSVLLDRFGEDDALLFMQAQNDDAPLYLAINRIKVKDVERFKRKLISEDISFDEVEVNGEELHATLKLKNKKDISHPFIVSSIEKGEIFVADAASQYVAHTVIAQFARSHVGRAGNDISFLEIGAGRGTKTLLLQSELCSQLASQSEHYIALDNMEFKTEILRKRVIDHGIAVEDVVCEDATKVNEVLADRSFDCIFIDSPCTGIGTIRRHPEIKYRCTSDTMLDDAEISLAMLKSASTLTKEGSILSFATCTVTLKENEEVLSVFLNSPEGSKFSLIETVSTSTLKDGCDSHFCAIMQRK